MSETREISEVCVLMPLQMSAKMISAIKENPKTKIADMKEMNEHIGWLTSAYEILIAAEYDRTT